MDDRHGRAATSDSFRPHPASQPNPGGEAPTAEQLRHAIDGGETGDKVNAPDPAAAPLGADDEAAGYSPTLEERRMAFRQEVSARQRTPRPRSKSFALMAGEVIGIGAILTLIAAGMRNLEGFALAYIGLSIASAVFVVVDILLVGRRQSMKIMEVVWPLTLLYWGPLGLPFYVAIGRPPVDHPHAHGEETMARATFKGAAHCGAGCAIGDFAAEWIALGTGFALFGSPLAGRFVLSFALAYVIGIAFQYFAIAPMRGLSLRDGVVAAIRADTLSLVAYEVGMFAVMALRAWLWPGLRPWDWTYWLIMQVAMIAGFGTTYPVNWLLIRIGVKERM